MPRRRPPRRKRVTRPPLPQPAAAAPVVPLGQGAVIAAPAPRASAPPRERSATRFTARDYTYVRRELRRIVILATVVIIAIVIISLFLP